MKSYHAVFKGSVVIALDLLLFALIGCFASAANDCFKEVMYPLELVQYKGA